jgi:hypothetical protein
MSRNTSKKRTQKSAHSGSTVSSSFSSQKKSHYNTKWLNNVVQGKGIIEIAIRQHKWDNLMHLITENNQNWSQIINSTDSDILLQLFRAHKYKLVLTINDKYPIEWTTQMLSYLIVAPPKICTITHKSANIQQQVRGKLYTKLYKMILNKVDINATVAWPKHIIRDEITNFNDNMQFNDNLSLLIYALKYSNVYVMNDLINRSDYKLGQKISIRGQSQNTIYFFIRYMISKDEELIKNMSDKTLYMLFIKKLFKRQNVNWNIKIPHDEKMNLLTHLYLIEVASLTRYNQTLYHFCNESIKYIDPNKPDTNGNYPLDIYMDHYNGNSPIYYPYIKILMDNGAYKFNVPIKMETNQNILTDNLKFVIQHYDDYHKTLLQSYRYIIKYIKDNNIVETLIKSRYEPEQRKKILTMTGMNDKNIEKTLFSLYNNVKIILSMCNYLSHTLLAHDRIITYQYYYSIPKEHREILNNILVFYTAIEGLNQIEHFKEKDSGLIPDIINSYNLHPMIYKFPVMYKISRKIMTKYPKNSYIVTVGESLNKILFLQELIEEHELKNNKNIYVNLPFSGRIDTNTNPETLKLATKYCKHLYEKNIHPEQIINQNKHITIVDFAASGSGIYSFVYMYYKLCTQGWSKYKLNKLYKLSKIITTSSWKNSLDKKLKDIGIKLDDISLPYHVLSYLYDTNDYRCLKQFKTDKWKELDDVNFDEKEKFELGKDINGCNLVRFYIIDKYLNFLANSKRSLNKKSTIKKSTIKK